MGRLVIFALLFLFGVSWGHAHPTFRTLFLARNLHVLRASPFAHAALLSRNAETLRSYLYTLGARGPGRVFQSARAELIARSPENFAIRDGYDTDPLGAVFHNAWRAELYAIGQRLEAIHEAGVRAGLTTGEKQWIRFVHEADQHARQLLRPMLRPHEWEAETFWTIADELLTDFRGRPPQTVRQMDIFLRGDFPAYLRWKTPEASITDARGVEFYRVQKPPSDFRPKPKSLQFDHRTVTGLLRAYPWLKPVRENLGRIFQNLRFQTVAGSWRNIHTAIKSYQTPEGVISLQLFFNREGQVYIAFEGTGGPRSALKAKIHEIAEDAVQTTKRMVWAGDFNFTRSLEPIAEARTLSIESRRFSQRSSPVTVGQFDAHIGPLAMNELEWLILLENLDREFSVFAQTAASF